MRDKFWQTLFALESLIFKFKIMSNLHQEEKQQQIIIVKSEKSMGMTILLTILFGPLGMFYSTTTGGIVMLIVSGLVALITLGFGLFFTWPVCIIWAAIATKNYNEKLTG